MIASHVGLQCSRCAQATTDTGTKMGHSAFRQQPGLCSRQCARASGRTTPLGAELTCVRLPTWMLNLCMSSLTASRVQERPDGMQRT